MLITECPDCGRDVTVMYPIFGKSYRCEACEEMFIQEQLHFDHEKRQEMAKQIFAFFAGAANESTDLDRIERYGRYASFIANEFNLETNNE